MQEKDKTSEKSKNLKVLRVSSTYHQLAKINAAKRGLNLQSYIETLLKADEDNKLDWSEE